MRRFTVRITRPAPSSFASRRTIMRTRLFTMVAALLLPAGAAAAQQDDKPGSTPAQEAAAPAPAQPPSGEFGYTNEVNFGYRGTAFGPNSDQARFQRYEDLRDGATLDRFRWSKSTNGYLMKLEADHFGYQDQRMS